MCSSSPHYFSSDVLSVQFSSVAQSCPALYAPMDCGMAAFHVHPNSQSLWNSCPLNRWCHPTISSSVIPFSPPYSIFPNIRVFSSDSVLFIRWPPYWSFSFSIILPMNVQDWFPSGLTGWISLLDLLVDSRESSPTPQFKSINSSALSFLSSPAVTSIHDYWKNHSFD